MIVDTNLKVANLDTDEIKANLQAYLSGQSKFQGYNFDGPALSILLDLLAYNTYLNSFYNNMGFAEQYLDSGVLRASVVSRAKELGYVPRSARSAMAKIQVTVLAPDNPAFITVAKGTKFGASLDGVDYIFVTNTDSSIVPDENGNYIGELLTYEGEVVTDTYVVAGTDPVVYVLPNTNVDTTSITVTVFDSETSTAKSTWEQVRDDILEVDNTSKVYYLQENMDGFYEVCFGDGVLGRKPSVGNKIVISYRVCNATAPNGINKFTRIDNLGSYASYSIKTLEAASGGTDPEDIESIRFNAPKHFARQGRTVIALDHKQLVRELHPDVQAVTSWGGEDNDPPIYGKVYLSLKPTNGFSFTQTRKQAIQASLEESAILGIDPVIVDPTFLYIVATADVSFDPNSTSLGAASIRQLASQAIADYEATRLGNFERKYRNSRLEGAIDAADQSIKSSNVEFLVQKRFLPVLNASYSYTLTFNFALRHPHDGYYGCVTSSGFRLPAYPQTLYIDDNGYGKLRAFYLSGDSRVYVANIGTINYVTGRLDLIGFNPVIIDGSEMKINVQSRDSVISPVRNQIIMIADSRVNVFNDNNAELVSSGTVITGGSSTTLYETPITPTVVI